jgi:hypothetical protein
VLIVSRSYRESSLMKEACHIFCKMIDPNLRFGVNNVYELQLDQTIGLNHHAVIRSFPISKMGHFRGCSGNVMFMNDASVCLSRELLRLMVIPLMNTNSSGVAMTMSGLSSDLKKLSEHRILSIVSECDVLQKLNVMLMVIGRQRDESLLKLMPLDCLRKVLCFLVLWKS